MIRLESWYEDDGTVTKKKLGYCFCFNDPEHGIEIYLSDSEDGKKNSVYIPLKDLIRIIGEK